MVEETNTDNFKEIVYGPDFKKEKNTRSYSRLVRLYYSLDDNFYFNFWRIHLYFGNYGFLEFSTYFGCIMTEKHHITEVDVEYGPDIEKEKDFRDHLLAWYARMVAWMITLSMVLGPLIFLYVVIFRQMWIFGLTYVCWMYYDKDTPHRGGRKIHFLKKLKAWESRRDYFPLRLVKTAELPPDTTYIFGSFPHGLLSASTWNFISDVNHFDEAYPGLSAHIVTLSGNFNIPYYRDVLLAFGACASSEKSIRSILNGKVGNVCVLMVGGVAEAININPGTNRIVLTNRKGFVRIALSTGSSLVPVYTFGETDTYEQLSGKWYKWLQGKIYSVLHRKFVIPRGQGVIKNWFRILPNKCPVTTVVGAPMKLPKIECPSQETIDKYHKQFTEELKALFNKYKRKYDVNGEKAVLHIE